MASSKTKKTSSPATPDWMSRVKESSHDVLLAGIGALARARKDGATPAKGGKTGKGGRAEMGGDFEALVSEGRKLEPEIKDSLQKVWTDLKEKSRTPMSFKPEGNFKGVFEQRVAEALARLGVPNAKEIDELKRKVDSLLKQGGVRTKAPVRKAASRKVAAKKTAATKKATGRKTSSKPVAAA